MIKFGIFQMIRCFQYGFFIVLIGVPVVAHFFDCRRYGQACHNGGTCTDAKPTCTCSPLYNGTDCALKVAEVVSDKTLCSPQCVNGGICKSSTPGIYTCYCPTQYYGESCSEHRAKPGCTGDRVTIDVAPYPTFKGIMYVCGHKGDPNCLIHQIGEGLYRGSYLLNGPCSIQALIDKPSPGDTLYIGCIMLQTSPIMETNRDLFIQVECKHSKNPTIVSGGIGSVSKNLTGGGHHQQTSQTVYEPVLFELQLGNGYPIQAPIYIGQHLKLFFPLADTRKYTKLFIVQCSAINGLQGNAKQTLTMISNGCPTIHGRSVVIGQVVTDPRIPAVIVNFKAFRFVTSKTIAFQCNIRVCTPQETECDPPLTCPSHGVKVRRKRDINRSSKDVVIQTEYIRVFQPLPEGHHNIILRKGEMENGHQKDSSSKHDLQSSETLVVIIVVVVAVILLLATIMCFAVRFMKSRSKL